jgi:Fe-S-cluster-containing hydrogenase component 2
MVGCTPQLRISGEVADAVRRARLVMVEAHEVLRASIECRHRAAAPCREAERLRAGRGTSTLHGTRSP